MKLTVEKAAFLKALSHAQSIVERRTVTPILANVLLKTTDQGLNLSATDLDLSLVETIPATVTEAGSTTVPAHMIYEIVRKISEDSPIELSVGEGENQLTLKAGKAKFALPVLPAEEFSPLKLSELPHKFQISAADMKQLYNTTRFAMSTEEARYYLNGIYFHTTTQNNQANLRAVATDGHRLARVETSEPQGSSGMPDVIIPRKTVNEVCKLMEDTEGHIDVALSLTQVSFTIGDVTLISRLVDGKFPDYENVIPEKPKYTLTVNGKKFASAVDRVATVSQEKSRGIKLLVEAGKVTVTANHLDLGSGHEELEADFTGTRLEAGFNARYLLDILQQIPSEQATLSFVDENSPVVIRATNGDNAVYVLMPMRV